jgi:hypothetical protein
MDISHLHLHVRDRAPAEAFYRRWFRLATKRSDVEGDRVAWVERVARNPGLGCASLPGIRRAHPGLRTTKSTGFVGPNSFGRDVALVLPAAAERLGQVDDRKPHVARGEDLQRLRLQELALRVEDFQVR